ncbi:MAG: hypothetical protein JXA57_00200 [Armatimonadetes bacterium]|nr:hypothetical protein [Armatimonadota bacterium]
MREARPRRKIGFAGCPPEEILAPRRKETLVDLDNEVEGAVSHSDACLPRTTCQIIRRIFDNAMSLDLDEIVIDEGYGKCDAARGLADILEDLLEISIIRTDNDNRKATGTPVSDSALPLRRKIELILEGLVRPQRTDCALEADPRAAIWGVPAADFALYDLFPDGTQVLGWTRCLENRTPADWHLEMWVPEGLPTVFFAQTFCAKNVIAHHLAHRYGGLHVDADGVLSLPVRAKIEAFLRFKGAWD